ncbi:MAG TPA: phosphoribosylanthranilate isomerase [Hyphomicrobium sp.]|nr:phosphoribosylanthranilate isomerase [Hyphomicrobium sp.]
MTVEAKICGISTVEALDAAIDGGARYVGFVSYPKSPRHVEPPLAQRLAAHARTRSNSIKVVALVVDPDDRALHKLNESVKPNIIQLHGSETPDRAGVIAAITGRAIWKAISVKTRVGVASAEAYLRPGCADLILFDAKPPDELSALPGGNGLAFDWTMLDAWPTSRPFVLAGGLTPENVGAAIRLTGASIVDVSSGVERGPGVKDPELIRRFLEAVKTAKQT